MEFFTQHPWTKVVMLVIVLSPVAYSIWGYFQKNKK